jgi:hypothetical protein
MQKLGKKLKNVPMDTSLVRSSTSSSLNRVQRLSEKSMCCSHNNPEVNLPEYTQGLKANYVYVLNIEGNPLMPYTPCKANK